MYGIGIAFNYNNMKLDSNKNIFSDSGDREAGRTIFCRLFSDQVSSHLCDIRRKELISQGTFTCEGCSFAPGDTSPQIS